MCAYRPQQGLLQARHLVQRPQRGALLKEAKEQIRLQKRLLIGYEEDYLQPKVFLKFLSDIYKFTWKHLIWHPKFTVIILRRDRKKRTRLPVGSDPCLGLPKNATRPLQQEQEAGRVGIGTEVRLESNQVLKLVIRHLTLPIGNCARTTRT